MFGEESIYGQSEVTLDDKGRIILPTDTKREKGDSLVLARDNDTLQYEICSYQMFDKIINELRNKVLNSTNKIDEIYYKKRIYEISKSIVKKLKVDSQGRVNIGKIYGEIDKILCIGACDRLILEPVDEKKSGKR